MQNFLIFLFLVIGGVLLEDILSRLHSKIRKKRLKSYHFSFSRYIFFLIAPLLATFFIATQTTVPVFTIFIVFALVGTLLEWLIGFSYHEVVGSRLWTYYTYPFYRRYTSFLSIPLWGLAGVLFWLLAKVF